MKRRRLVAGLVVVVLALVGAGCVVTPAPRPLKLDPLPPDMVAEYEPYGGEGTGSISGQAFLRTRGGEVRHAAGEVVTAEPAVERAVQWAERFTNALERRPPWPEVEAYRRTTRADADGRFMFDRLPAGRWLLISQVYWEVPSGLRYSPTERTGGMMMTVVDLAEGEQKTGLVLTR